MKKTFRLDIYTPYEHYFSANAEYLSLSSEKFTLGILPNHGEMISTVAICEITIQKNGEQTHYATSGGIIKVKDNQVDLLLQTIESETEIDLERAEKARERAENRLLHTVKETISETNARLALERAINRINIKKRKE